MNFSIERPLALYALLVLVPAIFVQVKKITRLSRATNKISFARFLDSRIHRITHILFLRLFLRTLAWISLVCAYAGFSWESEFIPTKKVGHAVACVFDISYSMTTEDAAGKLSRLEASAKYMNMLLPKMHGSFTSAILTKGDAVLALPMSEDTASFHILLDSLSPNLLTAAGSSLGTGIEKALLSFPKNTAAQKHVWFFTDGEETDSALQKAIDACIVQNVSLTFIGFGSERESEIVSGDGKTKVKTALRAEKLKTLIEKANAKTVRYIDASEVGSALSLLHELNERENGNAFEANRKNRFRFFSLLGLLFFGASFFVSEFDSSFFKKQKKAIASLSLIFLFFSCSNENFFGAKEIALGTIAYKQKNYKEAIAHFLKADESAKENGNQRLSAYAQFNLSASYLWQDEDEASLSLLKTLPFDCPTEVMAKSFYNEGIIFYKKGDYQKAAHFFREALKIDESDIFAKENLELANKHQKLNEEKVQEIESTPTIIDDEKANAIETAVFNYIREQDTKQWKNSESENTSPSTLDY